MRIFLPIIFAIGISLGKGVGNPWQNHDCSHNQLNVRWWYNWKTVNEENCASYFIPMVWSVGVGQKLLNGELELANSQYVLYLNEPDLVEQANNTPQEAVEMLFLLQNKYPNRKWIVGNVFNVSWLNEFMSLCKNCNIYGVGVHHYAWNYCSVEYLENKINPIKKYGKPIFVTEFACLSDNPQYQIDSLTDWLIYMDKNVEGYAPYATKNPDGFPATFDNANLIGTELGNWYSLQ